MTEKKHPWDWGVHIGHCCVLSCKYGDEDCPIATGQTLPSHPCEGCTCVQMNPSAIAKAQKWWDHMTPEQRARVFLEHRHNEDFA